MLNRLIEYALKSGADRVSILSAKDVVVDPGLAGKCRKCPNFGLSPGCPPHVAGPAAYEADRQTYQQALVFSIAVPESDLFSDKRRLIFRRLNQTAAGIEQAARRMGYLRANSFAGGSCRELFCRADPDCPVLTGKGNCRYPRQARPSMSGFGIDVARLFQAAGWTLNLAGSQPGTAGNKTADICGLVLID